ncbi:hypothetical protein ACKWTF_015001 [Chironomus riparius]
MKFFAFLLTFLLCVVNLKYAACLKCQFDYDSRSMEEKHDYGKTDENVKIIEVEGFNKKDLTQLDLTDLSPFCQRFENATFVWIRELKSVNENLIQQCTNLKNIWIEGLEMEEIPENLFSFNSNLFGINLKSGKLRTLPENVFSKQNELEILNLDNNQISCLPPNIFMPLTELSNLYLSNNKIHALNPKWFESLQSLEIFGLYNNEIQDLPKNAFASLSSLKELHLDSNQLTTIHSDSFGIHKNLQIINLQNNKINAIDERIINKTAVEWLDMLGNVCSRENIHERNKIKQELINCFSSYRRRIEPNEVQCGSFLLHSSRIINGSSTGRNDFPWNAALVLKSGSYFCGGTLVSNKHVVTAAHCMNEKKNAHKFTSCDFSVLLGVHNLSIANEQGRILVDVNAIHIHPDWDVHSDSYDADIAVLELAEAVKFNKFVRPICVPDVESGAAGASLGTVIGFGKTEAGTISDVAKKIEISIYDFKNCSEHSSDHRSLISHRTFCGGSADGRGVCDGDSGSGVYVIHSLAYYLRGIVSSSFNNVILQCDVQREAIFTDVPKFYGWIKSGGLDVHAENTNRRRN